MEREQPQRRPYIGSKHHLQALYITLINVPEPVYTNLTGNFQEFQANNGLTQEQAILVLSWAEKHRSTLRLCQDCGSPHHLTRRSRDCPFHDRQQGPITATTARDPDTAADIRRMVQQGAQQFQVAAANPNPPEVCPTCHLTGHSSSANRACPFHPTSKAEFMKRRMPGHEQYTRIKSFEAFVRKPFVDQLRQAVSVKSQYLKNVMTRLQLFMSDYAANHASDLTPFLLHQNGLYLVSQLIRGRRDEFVTKSAQDPRVPASLLRHWDNDYHVTLAPYDTYDQPGHTAELTMACKEQATANKNHISKNFEGRVKAFIKFRFAVDGELPNSSAMGAIKAYAYDNFALRQPDPSQPIPEEIPHHHRRLMNDVIIELREMKPSEEDITTQTLHADPAKYLPLLRSILDVYDYHRSLPETDDDPVTLPSFTLLPMPSNRPRFITITAENLPSLVNRPHHQISRQTPRRVPPVDDVNNEWHYGRMFSGVLRTDGVQMHVVFARLPTGPKPPLLYAQDFANTTYPMHQYALSGTDPGRRAVVTTSFGSGSEPHPIRRVSAKEYKTITKETVRQKHLNDRKNNVLLPLPGGTMATMATIESETPTTTTGDVVEFRQAVSHKLRHLTSTMAFYGSHSSKARFEAKKGQQRGAAACVNIMLTGSAKYCKAKRMKAKTRKNRRRRRKLSQEKRAIKQQIVRSDYVAVDTQIADVDNQIAVQEAAMDAIVSGIMDLDLSQNQAIQSALNTQVTAHELMVNTLEQHRLLLKNQKEQLQQKFLELNHSPKNPMKKRYHGSRPQQQGPSLVAFGAAMIGRDGARIRGHAVGRTDTVRNHLLERQSRALALLLHTDEYLTSQASLQCLWRPIVTRCQQQQPTRHLWPEALHCLLHVLGPRCLCSQQHVLGCALNAGGWGPACSPRTTSSWWSTSSTSDSPPHLPPTAKFLGYG
ncbi:hypothetical protein DM01DRAFT_1405059 [Hesseltinella vesiculosa]|uniref:Cytochrome c domain-containing protein n=1 Tax=Hesseltinella vesiculosa TaxID=101127 RepID=A0A1X2GR29_9FUNG|nr:hypothetical protein DM01DRAFT_1405059 [Hesseltinella vesiculosa]